MRASIRGGVKVNALAASLFALSMNVTASTLEVVNATSHLEARQSLPHPYQHRADVDAVKELVRLAVGRAGEMCEELERVQTFIAKKPDLVTDEMLHENPFPSMAAALRQLEQQLRGVDVPHELEKDAKELARAIAKVRSRASTISNSLRQMTGTPNTFESQINLNGLKVLAELGSARIVNLAG